MPNDALIAAIAYFGLAVLAKFIGVLVGHAYPDLKPPPWVNCFILSPVIIFFGCVLLIMKMATYGKSHDR